MLLAWRSQGPCATPFTYTQVTLTKQAYIQLKWEAHYGHAEWQIQYYIDQETARLYPEEPTHRPELALLPMAA